MLYYLITFILAVYLDSVKPDATISKLRKVFVCWFYIFFCFGYMTGSDWRQYELSYDAIDLAYKSNEFLFWEVYKFLHGISTDFFLALGILKIFYLHSVIRILKLITDKWMTVLALCMSTLMFMLIDNPLRFMVASILLMYAVYCFLQKKYILGLLMCVAAPFFHNVTIVIVPFILIGKELSRVNKWVLLIGYVIVTVLVFKVKAIDSLTQALMSSMSDAGTTNYGDYYGIEDNSSLFTIGSLTTIIFFILVVVNKELITKYGAFGEYIFSYSMLAAYLSRVAMIIPTGFRIPILFSFFLTCAIMIAVYSYRNKLVKYAVILFYLLSIGRDCNGSYSYVPYTNSIPYIVFGHKPYNERSEYNYIKYVERHGVDVRN